MRLAPLLVLTVLGVRAAAAAESLPSVSANDLVTLGSAVADLDLLKDNVYLYEEQADALRQRAKSLEHLKIEWTARVLRVTREEVLVDVPDGGHTRVLLRHAQPPAFGNLRSVWYCGGPSTQFYNQFAKPVGLRIGAEVPLELARQLRKKDQLRIVGQLDTVQAQIESVFNPRVLTIISDWVVVGVAPRDNSPR